jgi:hypothetical protein
MSRITETHVSIQTSSASVPVLQFWVRIWSCLGLIRHHHFIESSGTRIFTRQSILYGRRGRLMKAETEKAVAQPISVTETQSDPEARKNVRKRLLLIPTYAHAMRNELIEELIIDS